MYVLISKSENLILITEKNAIEYLMGCDTEAQKTSFWGSCNFHMGSTGVKILVDKNDHALVSLVGIFAFMVIAFNLANS